MDEELKPSTQELDFLLDNSKTGSSKPQNEDKSLKKNKETSKFNLDFLDDLGPKTKKLELKDEPTKTINQQSMVIFPVIMFSKTSYVFKIN